MSTQILSIDRQEADDRRWFKDRPFRKHRLRPPTAEELAALMRFSAPEAARPFIVARRIDNAGRAVRVPVWTLKAGEPDDVMEPACTALFDASWRGLHPDLPAPTPTSPQTWVPSAHRRA